MLSQIWLNIEQLLTTPTLFQWMQPCHREAGPGITGCSKVATYVTPIIVHTLQQFEPTFS